MADDRLQIGVGPNSQPADVSNLFSSFTRQANASPVGSARTPGLADMIASARQEVLANYRPPNDLLDIGSAALTAKGTGRPFGPIYDQTQAGNFNRARGLLQELRGERSSELQESALERQNKILQLQIDRSGDDDDKWASNFALEAAKLTNNPSKAYAAAIDGYVSAAKGGSKSRQDWAAAITKSLAPFGSAAKMVNIPAGSEMAEVGPDGKIRVLERNMMGRGGGLTEVQRRNNEEIDTARRTLEGRNVSFADIQKLTAKQTATGRDNPNYDPMLESIVRRAARRKTGDDADFESIYSRLMSPGQAGGPTGSSAPALQPGFLSRGMPNPVPMVGGRINAGALERDAIYAHPDGTSYRWTGSVFEPVE